LSRPNISVYITSYNQREYLVEAVESVLAQTLPASQIIVVDDCSQDGSQDVIAEYAARHSHITPIFHRINLGVAQTRNHALQMTTGDFVTYVDGDDRFLPDKLAKEVELLDQSPEADVVFSNVYRIAADGTRLGLWAARYKPPQGYVFCQTFARDFPNRVLFRNELVNYGAWKRIGFYDPGLVVYEDYDMRVRLTKQLRVAYCDQPLSEYRRHPQGLRNVQAQKKLDAFDHIVRKNWLLLQDIGPNERSYVRRQLNQWRAHLMRMGAKDALGAWQGGPPNRKRALNWYLDSWKYHFYFDLDLVLGLFLPRGPYQALRGAAVQLRQAVSDHDR
jgi:glycosyltransferase involved in cell wall biosynthesis